MSGRRRRLAALAVASGIATALLTAGCAAEPPGPPSSAVSPTVAAVTPDEPVYVLDTATGDLAAVAVPGNFSGVLCAGDLIAWRTLDGPAARATTTVVRWGVG